MTDNEINKEIANQCGWHMQHGEWIEPCGENKLQPPNYVNDLNAMHSAEATLAPIKIKRYISEIWSAMCRDGNAGELEIGTIHATARQRSEAFLKALGKWKE